MRIETVVVGNFQVNCWIVWGATDKAIVIDPGDEADAISSFIKRHDLSVAAYLLTHGHMDHISGLYDLHRLHPAPVALHAADLSWAFADTNHMMPFYGVPQRPARIERTPVDGDVFTDGGLNYRVMETPGHSPGSVCFLFPDEKALFCGDTLFAGSVGRTDLPGGNSRTLQASLKKLANLPDDVKVYPGHGPASDIGIEKATNYYMQGS